MGFLYPILIFAVISLISVQAKVIFPPPRQCCPEDEVFKSCGTACPLNCEDVLNSNEGKLCTLQCVSGCFCQQGYVRDKPENGTCIKSELCNKTTISTDQCPKNEVYETCGSACPKTCEDVLNPDVGKPCTDQCVKGCFCQEGYVRDKGKDGTCIKQELCSTTPLPKNCSENEVYETCGTACPETCKDVLNPNPNKMCTKQCVSGCFCQKGYVRDKGKNGTCIKRELCTSSSKECSKEHEIYQTCGTACPETCKDVLNPDPNKKCTLQCVEGCFCEKGYVRNDDGACIEPKECTTMNVEN